MSRSATARGLPPRGYSGVRRKPRRNAERLTERNPGRIVVLGPVEAQPELTGAKVVLSAQDGPPGTPCPGSGSTWPWTAASVPIMQGLRRGHVSMDPQHLL